MEYHCGKYFYILEIGVQPKGHIGKQPATGSYLQLSVKMVILPPGIWKCDYDWEPFLPVL